MWTAFQLIGNIQYQKKAISHFRVFNQTSVMLEQFATLTKCQTALSSLFVCHAFKKHNFTRKATNSVESRLIFDKWTAKNQPIQSNILCDNYFSQAMKASFENLELTFWLITTQQQPQERMKQRLTSTGSFQFTSARNERATWKRLTVLFNELGLTPYVGFFQQILPNSVQLVD